MSLIRRIASTTLVAAAVGVPTAVVPATSTAAAAVPVVNAQAFGMHVLGLGSHAYPPMSFGTARIWDMGVTWADLQPKAPPAPLVPVATPLTPPSPAPWDASALSRLDGIVNTFTKHHVQPILTLGMTPSWEANTGSSCHHVAFGRDWGLQTCAPKDDVTQDANPWAQYVDFLAKRYQGKIRYFELWNEPSLANGYNDSLTTLAAMQAKATGIVHKYGAQLIAPGVPFTNGSPTNGYNWLRKFLGQPGGTSYDITGLHLYPSDSAARAGYGPEWSMNTALVYARRALSAFGVSGRPIWDTEHNVGRAPAHTGYRESVAGAAAVARTFVLATENHVARTFWYAADDRTWGGTWLERRDLKTLSTPGVGYRAVRSLIIGKAPLGCSQPRGTARGAYTCRFGTSTGHRTLLVVWTTGKRFTYHAPRGTKAFYTLTGGRHGASRGKSFTITSTPLYLTGSF